ncbi:MAG TPA: glycoside hydrolase family 43 protein, partial [Chthoniobacterales bacterium]
MTIAKACEPVFSPASSATFSNPLLPKPSQDPWVTFRDGTYHALNTDGRVLWLRRSSSVRDLYHQAPVPVWTAPMQGPHSKHLWAPELHFLNGKWFIYYAADNGRNRNHRLWALEAEGADAAGPYRHCGMLQTGTWAIDATVLRDHRGELYMLWSGWERVQRGPQNLYLSSMDSPTRLRGPRVRLAEPVEPWENCGAPVCEGPAVLQRNGLTCVIYSAGASWMADSCLGLLVNRDGNLLDPLSWEKTGPVFARTEEVWGLGHCSFVNNHDGDPLMFYHAKTRLNHGWKDRNVRAQHFTWGPDGLPHFGRPVAVPSA